MKSTFISPHNDWTSEDVTLFEVIFDKNAGTFDINCPNDYRETVCDIEPDNLYEAMYEIANEYYRDKPAMFVMCEF